MARSATWLSAMLLVLAVGACTPASQTASTSATPRLEAGWQAYADKASGFSIAVPPNWGRIDLTVSPAELAATFKDNPQFATFLQEQQSNAYIKFFAIDHQTLATGFATNVNVIAVPVDASVTSLDQAVADETASFQQLAVVPSRKRTHVAAGAAEEFDYALPLKTSSGATMLAAVKQFLLLRVGKAEFVVTFETPRDQASAYSAVFGKIAATFSYG